MKYENKMTFFFFKWLVNVSIYFPFPFSSSKNFFIFCLIKSRIHSKRAMKLVIFFQGKNILVIWSFLFFVHGRKWSKVDRYLVVFQIW